MENIKLYRKYPFRSIIVEPSASRKTCFLTKLILEIIINYFTQIFIYLPSIREDTYQILIE